MTDQPTETPLFETSGYRWGAISEIHELVELVEAGTLTTNQFYGVVRMVLGIDQRSEQSQAIGRLIIAVQKGETPLSSLIATIEEGT